MKRIYIPPEFKVGDIVDVFTPHQDPMRQAVITSLNTDNKTALLRLHRVGFHAEAQICYMKHHEPSFTETTTEKELLQPRRSTIVHPSGFKRLSSVSKIPDSFPKISGIRSSLEQTVDLRCPRGLVNFDGVSCYMNVCLQTLHSIPGFNAAYDIVHLKRKKKIVNALSEAFTSLDDRSNINPAKPTALWKLLPRKRFPKTQQQDSHELFEYLLDDLSPTVNPLGFMITLNSARQCSSCPSSSITSESHHSISLSFPDTESSQSSSVTLDELFTSFLEETSVP